MTDLTIDIDEFGRTMEQILENVDNGVKQNVMPEVEKSLEKGERAWKKNAKAVLSKSYSRGGWGRMKSFERYKRGKNKGKVKPKSIKWYGRTYKTGKYARSIRHQLLTSGEEVTEGEIGSPTVPGLAHLLEKGHGFFTAAPHVHIAPAAEETFKDFERTVDMAVERAINDA